MKTKEKYNLTYHKTVINIIKAGNLEKDPWSLILPFDFFRVITYLDKEISYVPLKSDADCKLRAHR